MIVPDKYCWLSNRQTSFNKQVSNLRVDHYQTRKAGPSSPDLRDKDGISVSSLLIDSNTIRCSRMILKSESLIIDGDNNIFLPGCFSICTGKYCSGCTSSTCIQCRRGGVVFAAVIVLLLGFAEFTRTRNRKTCAK